MNTNQRSQKWGSLIISQLYYSKLINTLVALFPDYRITSHVQIITDVILHRISSLSVPMYSIVVLESC